MAQTKDGSSSAPESWTDDEIKQWKDLQSIEEQNSALSPYYVMAEYFNVRDTTTLSEEPANIADAIHELASGVWRRAELQEIDLRSRGIEVPIAKYSDRLLRTTDVSD